MTRKKSLVVSITLSLAALPSAASAQTAPPNPAIPNTPEITTSKIVAIAQPGDYPGSSGTLANSPIQVIGMVPGNTGIQAIEYGPNGHGVTNMWAKTRGATPGDYAAVQIGDRVVADIWQASTGSQTGHVGGTRVTIDSATFTAGEVAGRWALFTGTGIHVSQASKTYPTRYGSMNAIVANSFQQVIFPGGAVAGVPGNGNSFGGWVTIGAGAATPGFGPLKFLTTGALLLTVPEAGAFEVDAAARPYFTAADGVRRGFVLADTAAPTVRALLGAGATARIDASGNAGVVTLITGSGITGSGITGTGTGTGTGDLFAVSYAHPYPAASYPVISAANAAAVALVRGAYLTATAAGFTVSLSAGTTTSAGTTYAITFGAPGR